MEALASVTGAAKPLIRLHGWGMVSPPNQYHGDWLNPDGTWNAAKIGSALAPLVEAGYPILINIPSGPHGETDVKDPDAFASFAAALVKIVNRDHRLAVRYWEIPNEREDILTAAEMSRLLSKASRAMKAVDPGILVGGPAMASVKLDYIAEVVQKSLADLDFFSVHTYGGDGTQPDSASYASAIRTGKELKALRARLDDAAGGKYLPIFLDEYNVGWDFTPKIRTNVGAVYFSLILGGVVDAGAQVSAVWDVSPIHDMSVVGPDTSLYASAHVLSLMNRFFYGKRVFTSSSDEAAVYAYAVDAGFHRSVLVANRADSGREVNFAFLGWMPRKLTVYRITPAGFSSPETMSWPELLHSGLSVPGNSVAFVIATGRSDHP